MTCETCQVICPREAVPSSFVCGTRATRAAQGVDRRATPEPGAQGAPSLILRNSHFENAAVGVHVGEGATVDARGNTFKNVREPFRFAKRRDPA